MRTTGWFLHPAHGYMLRGPKVSVAPGEDWQTVVTSLLRENREVEESREAWEAQGSRLHVNAGCGQIAADELRVGDHNPEFKPIPKSKVPAHIREEFEKYI